ncbi:MAG: hypothetical protein KKD86_16660 [Bacteroidetes bacterium]|nr:hypothetical protein [Bacteroidota bacterium]MBU1680457.1 hypothetical protein [Bacteroidota bacterium]
MKNYWNSIPEQVKRISILLIVIVAAFIVIRANLVPKDFGELGHYRTSAIDEIIAQNLKYGGEILCSECHDDVAEKKASSFHKNVSCEVCHGPAADHADDPDSFTPAAPKDRDTCPICHEYLQSRPTGFPQIISVSHNPFKPCKSCHNAHDPTPPETPKECSACHKEIFSVKSLSHHAFVECKTCHKTKDNHRLSPREFIPEKPTSRNFCGQCHSDEIVNNDEIPKISMTEHEPKYVCWQCHYPHQPEAK